MAEIRVRSFFVEGPLKLVNNYEGYLDGNEKVKMHWKFVFFVSDNKRFLKFHIVLSENIINLWTAHV